MLLMLLGDTHGNGQFMQDVAIPAATSRKVGWIYQVGDFGYWEHELDGESYLSSVNKSLAGQGINLVFIQGNHDKVSLIAEKYVKVDGFYMIRSNIWFAPNGSVWSPNQGKTHFMALGGAYSIDKQWRLDNEAVRGSGYGQSLWFPEEEMTDRELDDYLAAVDVKIDVLLTHDKPISSNTPGGLLPIYETQANQRRIQKAVKFLQPSLLVHGHLHKRYTDFIRTGDNTTQVLSLGADVSPNRNDAWEFLTIKD